MDQRIDAERGANRDDRMEMIKCLVCRGSTWKSELLDHIACTDLSYTPHGCNDCTFDCFDDEKAIKHAKETHHTVLLNKSSTNRYLEEMIMKAYGDSLRAHYARMTQAAVREMNRHESPQQMVPDKVERVSTELMIPADVERVGPEPLEEQRFEEGREHQMHESPQPMVSANAERVGPEPKRRKRVLVNEGGDHTKRPMTAFEWWRRENSDRLVEKARATGDHRQKVAGAEWKLVEDKSRWEEMAAAGKERYMQASRGGR